MVNRFSIIVPFKNTDYNRFVQCIRSISEQTFKDFELILVNDGSDREYMDMVFPMINSQFESFILVSHPNKSILQSRVAGIKVANGEFIVHIDSDDYVEPNHLEYLNSEISKWKDIYDLSAVFTQVINEDHRFIKPPKPGIYTGTTVQDFILDRRLPAYSVTKCIKRDIWMSKLDILESIGYANMAEDQLSLLVLSNSFDQVLISDISTYHYDVPTLRNEKADPIRWINQTELLRNQFDLALPNLKNKYELERYKILFTICKIPRDKYTIDIWNRLTNLFDLDHLKRFSKENGEVFGDFID